jgi:hypothetical protein
METNAPIRDTSIQVGKGLKERRVLPEEVNKDFSLGRFTLWDFKESSGRLIQTFARQSGSPNLETKF